MTKKEALEEAIEMLSEWARAGNDRASEIVDVLTVKKKFKVAKPGCAACKKTWRNEQ